MLFFIRACRIAREQIKASKMVPDARLSTGEDLDEDDDEDLTEEQHTFEPDDEFDEEDFDDDFDEDFEEDFEEVDLPGDETTAADGANGDDDCGEEISDEDI